MTEKPRLANDGAIRPGPGPLKEGYVRKGGINPPPQNFQRPDPPPAFKPVPPPAPKKD
jgi:hypothetical protein